MKKTVSNLFNISALLLIILSLTACKGKLPDNYFKVDGEAYEINSGYIINNGQVNGGFNVDLKLSSSDGKNYIIFSIISEQAESIGSKTYALRDGKWVAGSDMAGFASGSVVVDRKSGGYTIDFKCKDKYSNNVEGHFKGTLSSKDNNNTVNTIPNYVIPKEIYSDVEEYFPIHTGNNIPNIDGEYLSSPHILVYQSDSEKTDSVIYFSDCYVGFMNRNNQMTFYKKQYDPTIDKDIEEIYYNVKISGDNNYFTCYYVLDGYPEGYYAQQSFLFSGRKTEQGIEDFHTAVILLETSGHPNLPAKNTFRVLKDQDGMAYANDWLSKSPAPKRGNSNNNADSFKIWMK